MFLNSHSWYSLRYGTLSVERLVEEAERNGLRALALTDINNSTGVMEFVRVCREKGIKPLAGIEFRADDRLLYVGIARNNEGFRELNEFLSHHNLREKPLPEEPPALPNAVMIRPYVPHPLTPSPKGEGEGGRGPGGEVVGIRPADLRKLVTLRDRSLLRDAVILAPVTFATQQEYELHRNLRAVDHNILLSRLAPGQFAGPEERMFDLRSCFRDFPELIRNTERLLDDCSIGFDFSTHKNKSTFTGNRYDDKILLEKLALDGLAYRYGKSNREARRRVAHELEIIDTLGFSAYFLIAWDIIRYSMARGFYHIGRGSGANSIIAYCLRITDVDPIDLDLYFERFLNPKRTSPPDFDIDYSWRERNEVLDYIFKRHGRKHTALLGAMSTFKGNSIYRELGKVHGIPKEEMDHFLKHPEEELHRSALMRKIQTIGEMMTDFPNLRSIHAGGVLISDLPITTYTALDLPPKGFPTTQWDMYVAEDIGFEKLDILSQRGIGHIRESAEVILRNRHVDVDVHRIELFKRDEKVKALLRSGDTIGCFYVESPAMRGLLKKLHCDNYLTLVAASSIIRPGVARSGMMKEYIYRFHHPGQFRYLHPIMEEQLKETYGVMVYQEDVLKICHHFAGLDLADADVLRRAMSGKYRSKKELERIVNRFFENCRSFGYPEATAKEVWRQIESFAGYSFSKAHSASYAVESFQSLYLKAHYPLEFLVAVINNFGGFYPSWVYFNEARNLGATLHLPCVNNGSYHTSIRGTDIYIGLIHVAGVETQAGQAIVEERLRGGEFGSLENFTERTGITLDQLIILIRIGAFRFTGKTKAQLLWEAHMISRQLAVGSGQLAVGSGQLAVGSRQSVREQVPGKIYQGRQNEKEEEPPRVPDEHEIVNRQSSIVNPVLFSAPLKRFELPAFEQTKTEDIYDEVELLGFPIRHTYFDLLETGFRGEVFAKNMMEHLGKKVRMLGQLVTIKYVRTIKKEWMHFGTFTDVHGHFFDTVHFPKAVNDFPFRGDGIYLVLGKIVEEFGFPSLEVEKMAKMPLKKDPRA